MIQRQWRHFDWVLLLLVLLLSIYGIFMIRSAVSGDPVLVSYPDRQVRFVLGGLALMFLVASLDYHSLGSIAAILYGVVLGLLMLVGVVGQRIFGAQSWLELAGVVLQPSELAKIILLLALGRYLAMKHEHMERLSVVLIGVAIVLPLVGLVVLEPDLGTAIVLLVEAVLIFWVAGVHWRHIAGAGVLGLLASPLLWSLLLPHQRNRILIFLDPAADPDSAFNVQQALVSVGSGGLLGKGYGMGTQSQLHFLRVRHTDFIFSVVAEEMGFVGALLLMVLLALILLRLWRIAVQAPDVFGRLLVTGTASVILFQSVVNIGMNMGLLPVTGLPLPFVSYGGSAYLSLMIMVGLAQSVAMSKRSQVL